jgi:hypothetical protein
MNRRSFLSMLAAVAAAPVIPTPTAFVADPITGISLRFIREWKPADDRFYLMADWEAARLNPSP